MDSILIVAHGSSEDLNGNAVEYHAERLSHLMDMDVYYAYKGDMEPTIDTALECIADSGADTVIVLPLFFAPGFFADTVIPKRFGADNPERTGNVEVDGKVLKTRVCQAFGVHEYMDRVMNNVVYRALEGVDEAAVILVGHGSKDGKNKATVEKCAEYVMDIGYDTYPCFNEFNEPDLEDTFNDCLSEYDFILVIPMFVSSSNHSVNEIPEKMGMKPGERSRSFDVDGRHVLVMYTTEIGMEQGITDILADMAFKAIG